MSVYRKICAKSYAMESDTVKAEVQKLYDEKHEDKGNSLDKEGDEESDEDNDEKSLLQCQQE